MGEVKGAEMTESEIKEKISECQKRKKEYIRLIKDMDVMRLAYARSVATETLNIAEYKKQLKEQK